MRFLIDTDHASSIQQKTEREFTAISRRLSAWAETDVVYSIITVHEQFLGSHAYINKAQSPWDAAYGYERLAKLVDFDKQKCVVSFDEIAAAEFARLKAARVRIGPMDPRIASIALTRGLVLVTRNSRDFRKVPDLEPEDWTVPAR